jgi:serine/threonine-protein kinase
MEKQRWQKIGQIVDGALEIEDKSSRTAYIKEKCKDDESLITEVYSFIHSIEESDGLWEDLLNSNMVIADDMAGEMSQDSGVVNHSSPESIGPYLVKKLLAKGGMGNIYLAERKDADFHKNVAIKIVRKEINSQVTIQRFIQERSILSSLNHPNIAQLLDGGITKDGRPYFVMEYIDGVPITEFCNNNRCDLTERLSLFRKMCDAVQYAHTNFVVHRDLKPSNILVDKAGNLKILDFGIAKLTDGKLDEKSLIQTREGYRMLSLNYAAPEQITGEPVTTATDVYSLGLLLFELLTNERAYSLKNKNLLEAERIIRENDPTKPSLVNREWNKLLQGDLDAITMKAIRKEAEQRYESARLLLDDIDAYLNDKPVTARHSTLYYKAGKFVRRNKINLSFAAVIAAILIIIPSFYASMINEERRIAESEAQKAEQISGFLVGLFEGADPFGNTEEFGLDTNIGSMLELGEKRIDSELDNQPAVRAALNNTIGRVYFSLGEYDRAEELYSEALQIAEDEGIEKELPLYTYRLGHLYQQVGNIEAADSLLLRSIELFERSEEGFQSEEAVSALSTYGSFSWFNKGDTDTAEEYLIKSLEQRQIHFAENDSLLAPAYNDLANLYHSKGNFEEAENYYSQAVDLYVNLLDDNPKTAITMANFSMLLRDQGKLEQAKQYQESALSIVKNKEDQYKIDIALGNGNLSEINMRQGNHEVADSLGKTALSMLSEIFGDLHPYVARTKLVIGMNYFYTSEYDEAEKMFIEAKEEYEKVYPPEHSRLADPHLELGKLYTKTNDLEKALDHVLAAREIYKSSLPDGNVKRAMSASVYGEILSMRGDVMQADSLLKKGVTDLEKLFSDDDDRLAEANMALERHQNRHQLK